MEQYIMLGLLGLIAFILCIIAILLRRIDKTENFLWGWLIQNKVKKPIAKEETTELAQVPSQPEPDGNHHDEESADIIDGTPALDVKLVAVAEPPKEKPKTKKKTNKKK